MSQLRQREQTGPFATLLSFRVPSGLDEGVVAPFLFHPLIMPVSSGPSARMHPALWAPLCSQADASSHGVTSVLESTPWSLWGPAGDRKTSRVCG